MSWPLSHSQEIGEQFGAIDSEETLGVKLHTFDVLAAISESAAEAHDNAACAAGFGGFIGPGGNLPLCSISLWTTRNSFREDDQRVVASGDKRVRETGKNAAAIVMHRAGFTVDLDHMASDSHAVTGGETLVTEADTENWYATGEAADDVAGIAGFIGRAGTGGDDDVCGVLATVEGLNLVGRNLIIANHENVAVEIDRWIDLAKSVDEIPGE